MKKIFKLMAMAVVAMAAVTFTACNADDDYFVTPQSDEYAAETRSSDNSVTINNTGSKGVLVLEEGNMTSENGFLNFIPGGANQYYHTMVTGKRIANVCQDLYIYNDKIYIIAQNTETGSNKGGVLTVKNAVNFATTKTYTSEISGANNPTHVAVYNDNVIYLRGSGEKYDGTGSGNGIYRFNVSDNTFKRLDDGGATAAATPMVIVGKYLYVCYNDGVRVYDAATQSVEFSKVSDIAGAQCVVKSTDGTKVYVYSSKNIYEITPSVDALKATRKGTTSAAISTWSNSAQVSYYNDALYYATAAGAAYRFDLADGVNSSLGSIYTGASQTVIGSTMYNGVAVDPGTGYLYVATTTYGTTYSDVNALNVFDVKNGAFTRVQTFVGDERFTAGIFFPENFGCDNVGTGQYETKTPEKYVKGEFYE